MPTVCKTICFLTAAVVLAVPLLIAADAPAPAQNNWFSETAGQNLKLEILQPKKIDLATPVPLIVYLKNLAAPRAGTDSDEAIIRDFLERGFLVATVDYSNNPKARVPFINRDLLNLRSQLLQKEFLHGFTVDPSRIFIVPSGCRLLTDVLFYQDAGRKLAMDIIYPAHPLKLVGAVLEFSCDNQNRMGNGSLVSCSDTVLDGEATEGLAVAIADHPVKAPYKGIDPMPDCARKIKAAVRTLRAQSSALGLDGKVAPVGFSRGSGMALMLVTTKGMNEFEGFGENTNLASDVQGAVVMSGRFTYLDLLPDDHMLPRYAAAWGDHTNHLDVWRREGALDYLQTNTVPLFLTINCSEGADAQHQMAALRKRLAELGNDEIFMMDRQPRGHKVTLVPEILDAINTYLKSCVN